MSTGNPADANANGQAKPTAPAEQGNGLAALKQQLGNLGAIGIVCAAFWLLLQNNIQQAGEDRKLFREAVRDVSESVKRSGELQASALKDLGRQIEQMGKKPAP